MVKEAIQILELKIGLISNNKDILPRFPLKTEVASLLTDFHQVNQIEFNGSLDCYLIIIDDETLKPKINISEDTIIGCGPYRQLNLEADDLRYSFFGNEGLIFRYALACLERNYEIFSYHACSLYDENVNRLYIACGGAGSGKTCLILKGLEQGLKLFSTEMTHFHLKNGSIRFYKGSLLDNVRIANLKYHYPSITEKLGVELPKTTDEWGKKIAIDLTKFEASTDEIVDPEIVLLFPHIEENRKIVSLIDISDKERTVTKLLFDNSTQKIGEEFLLYESIPLKGLDTMNGRIKRLNEIKRFIEVGKIKKSIKVVAGAKNCLDGII